MRMMVARPNSRLAPSIRASASLFRPGLSV